ncbi:hypothetical protein AB0E10_20875 [Streptomyces sp. NPDC048045]|uniref:hypothetical protein n=1 Tax=Streptomyces sp. NPDC048045 TaxID=3154710 RepID=UPI0034357B08
MSTTRRRLGTGPAATPAASPGIPEGRLMPVERADLTEHQDDVGSTPRNAGGPVSRRRPLSDRGAAADESTLTG